MREACGQPRLAERAFFRFPRAGKNVSGPSVHLARELARCWRNIDHGVVELDRDDERGASEMLAYAWCMESNTRASSTFQVPHTIDLTGGGTKTLTSSRDIYENNANQGARRLREAIFAILPAWFVEEAKELCTKTLQDGGGEPLAKRVEKAINLLNLLGISTERIERSLGDGGPKESAKWDEHDVAKLGVIYRSIQNGETNIDAEFPPVRVSMDDVAAPSGGGKSRSRRPEPPAAEREAAPNAPDPAAEDDPTLDPNWGKS